LNLARGDQRENLSSARLASKTPFPASYVSQTRPRRAPIMVIEFRDRLVDPKDVQFSLLDNGEMAGVYLFIPGFREDDVALKQIGYLFLDAALGEYDVETRLGLIKMLSPETQTDGDRYPLAELPARFNRLVSRLEGRTRFPHSAT
jgi:hypothetical protein